MGYYTQFELQVVDGDYNLIEEFRQECDHAQWCLREDGTTREEGKWYRYEQDMGAFSQKHPTTLFVMSGIGEESDDIWRQYWKGGKSQYTKAKLVYEDYDEFKLE